MRNSFLHELLFSDDGMSPLSIIWLVITVILVLSRTLSWVRFVWLPVFVVSVVFSVPVIGMLLAGGYALFGLPTWGAFPVIALTLFVARPKPAGLAGPAWVGCAVFGAVIVVMWSLPRRSGTVLRLRFVEGNGGPVANATFPLFIHPTSGGNLDGLLRTDANGHSTLTVYGYDTGNIELRDRQDPRRNKTIHFEAWPASSTGRPAGAKFDRKDIVTGNSGQALTIVWPDKRDMAAVETEPTLVFRPMANFTVGEAPLVLDVATGQFGREGDLVWTITTGPERGPFGPEFRVVVRARTGAGLVVSDEQFMDLAPETGYQPQAEFRRLAHDSHYAQALSCRFYVKTREGKFAKVAGEVRIFPARAPESGSVFASMVVNPSGSRKVEFDHKKWLNRD